MGAPLRYSRTTLLKPIGWGRAEANRRFPFFFFFWSQTDSCNGAKADMRKSPIHSRAAVSRDSRKRVLAVDGALKLPPVTRTSMPERAQASQTARSRGKGVRKELTNWQSVASASEEMGPSSVQRDQPGQVQEISGSHKRTRWIQAPKHQRRVRWELSKKALPRIGGTVVELITPSRVQKTNLLALNWPLIEAGTGWAKRPVGASRWVASEGEGARRGRLQVRPGGKSVSNQRKARPPTGRTSVAGDQGDRRSQSGPYFGDRSTIRGGGSAGAAATHEISRQHAACRPRHVHTSAANITEVAACASETGSASSPEFTRAAATLSGEKQSLARFEVGKSFQTRSGQPDKAGHGLADFRRRQGGRRKQGCQGET